MQWKYPNRIRLIDLLSSTDYVKINGLYIQARPLGFPAFSNRLALAWAVFTGRMDALEWPEGQ